MNLITFHTCLREFKAQFLESPGQLLPETNLGFKCVSKLFCRSDFKDEQLLGKGGFGLVVAATNGDLM